MTKQFSFLEFYLEPDLDTFSDAYLAEFRKQYEESYATGENPPYCSALTIKSPKGASSMIPGETLDKIRIYDYYIKGMYWELLQSGRKLSPDSYLLDLVPGVHWIDKTWSPDSTQSRFNRSVISKEYVIPEIIRPYVDFVNSIDEVRRIIQDNFIGNVNFQIFQGSDIENSLYCHLNYGSDGRLTLVEKKHPSPDLSLKGSYKHLCQLFHLGEKRPERDTALKYTGRPLWRHEKISTVEWKMNHFFDDRAEKRFPAVYAPLGHFMPIPNTNSYEVLKQWIYTLLKVEEAYATRFDIFHDRVIKRCTVCFDDNQRLLVKIQYRDDEKILNYYPKSLNECFCIFIFIENNLNGQVIQIYHE
ncbi:MAG: hypothetical protein ACFFFG_12365 [Candidatus Thorarchaeota archaeon]